MLQKYQKEKVKARADGDLENRQIERTPQKCSRCGSEYHLIERCPKPPKENGKQRKQVNFNEKGNRACNRSKNISNQNIYAYIAHISGNDKCPSRHFGDSFQLTIWILDSGVMCHMTPEVSDFISGLLEDIDKHIEVADGHQVTAKQKGQVQIKMCDNN